MKLQEDVKSLIMHIESLTGFKRVRPELQPPYGNMGATITDAILQAGTTWSTVVKPRLKKLLERNDAQTTDGFLDLLISEGARQILDWEDTIKPKRIHRLANLLSKEGVQTEDELKIWLQDEKNVEKLKCVDGIGNKTIDYLKILAGLPAIAVDRHIIRFLREAGIDIGTNDYQRAREIVCEAAIELNIDLSTLDHSIWSYMSEKPKPRNICEKSIMSGNQNDVEPSFCYIQIGPYRIEEIVLCSADAGPTSQKSIPDQAQYFYPKAKWVGTLRNASNRLNCDFYILTTYYGLVEPHQIIAPYDMHINEYREEVTRRWLETIPALVRCAGYRLMVFYSGGCPRDEMIEVMLPILMQQRIALLTFGRPNMFDVGKIDTIWGMLQKGSTDEEIKSVLRVPERFKYYPVDNIHSIKNIQNERRRQK